MTTIETDLFRSLIRAIEEETDTTAEDHFRPPTG